MSLLAREDARPALQGWLDRHGTLFDAAAAQPGAEALTGRGRVHVVPAPAGAGGAERRWVVRHYQRGGAVARLLADRYVRGLTPRPFREYRLLERVEALGVPVPRVVAAAVYPAGPFYRGDLVTELVPDSGDLADLLFGTPPPGVEVVPGSEAAGRVVRLMHDRGVVHPDLNLKNILLRQGPGGPEALVLDLDRGSVRRRLPEWARRRMLARFERSLRKLERAAGAPAPRDALQAFLRGYAAGGASPGNPGNAPG